MPTQNSQSNSRLPPLSTSYCSTINSTSTSCTDMSSPAVSSRVLYHESFGRPVTSKSLPPPIEEAQFSPLPEHRRHHHTSSAETYTTKQKDRNTDSSWHFGKTLSSGASNNHGVITTEEEFDALPIAVRRKFFSTLERLRFAQSTDPDITLPHHNSPSDRPSAHASPHTERRALNKRGTISGRRGVPIAHINSSKPSQRLRKSFIYSPDQFASIDSPDTPESSRAWFKALPEKIQQSQFSKEEQIALAGRLKEGRGNRGRESVILDAADEAFWKASYHRPANQTKRKDMENLRESPLTESSRSSMDSMRGLASSEEVVTEGGEEKASKIPDTDDPYESFRWLDEETDLDLSLHNHLDDYHANLPDSFLNSTSSSRRPSFRRQLSISKFPFGGNINTRNSISSPTSSGTSSTRPSVLWAAPPSKGHDSKKSRALSLMPLGKPSTTKNSDAGGHQDPNASHWQDPDARLKLRVYLASPQKFDEAIEFGFPSLDRDTVSKPPSDKENRPPIDHKTSRESLRFRHGGEGSHDTATTFLNDDEELVFGDEDDASMLDPDSPQTPLDIGDPYNPAPHRSFTPNSNSNAHGRYVSKRSTSLSGSASVSRERSGEDRDYSHLGITKPMLHKRAETDSFLGSREGRGYMQQQVGPGNREMTLRMTLTRPDLRTDIPPPVPEKDRPTRPSTDRGVYGRSIDKVERPVHGIGIDNIGWQNAVTRTTVTAGQRDIEDKGKDGWDEKCDIVGVKGPFGGPDGWGSEKEDGGVVKRFFNRQVPRTSSMWRKVKSSQKRII